MVEKTNTMLKLIMRMIKKQTNLKLAIVKVIFKLLKNKKKKRKICAKLLLHKQQNNKKQLSCVKNNKRKINKQNYFKNKQMQRLGD